MRTHGCPWFALFFIMGEGMELQLLLEQAISKMQNLQEYYENQISEIKGKVKNDIKKYKWR